MVKIENKWPRESEHGYLKNGTLDTQPDWSCLIDEEEMIIQLSGIPPDTSANRLSELWKLRTLINTGQRKALKRRLLDFHDANPLFTSFDSEAVPPVPISWLKYHPSSQNSDATEDVDMVDIDPAEEEEASPELKEIAAQAGKAALASKLLIAQREYAREYMAALREAQFEGLNKVGLSLAANMNIKPSLDHHIPFKLASSRGGLPGTETPEMVQRREAAKKAEAISRSLMQKNKAPALPAVPTSHFKPVTINKPAAPPKPVVQGNVFDRKASIAAPEKRVSFDENRSGPNSRRTSIHDDRRDGPERRTSLHEDRANINDRRPSTVEEAPRGPRNDSGTFKNRTWVAPNLNTNIPPANRSRPSSNTATPLSSTAPPLVTPSAATATPTTTTTSYFPTMSSTAPTAPTAPTATPITMPAPTAPPAPTAAVTTPAPTPTPAVPTLSSLPNIPPEVASMIMAGKTIEQAFDEYMAGLRLTVEVLKKTQEAGGTPVGTPGVGTSATAVATPAPVAPVAPTRVDPRLAFKERLQREQEGRQ